MSKKSSSQFMSEHFREAAAKVLGHLEGDKAIQTLCEKLNDPDFRVRKQVLLVMSEVDDQAIVPVVTKSTKDENPGVREAALIALSKHTDKVNIEPFIRCTKDANEWVRLTAIRALKCFPQNQMALHTLLQMLTDSNENILEAVIETLSSFVNQNVVNRLIQLFQTSNERIQSRIIVALGDSLPEEIIHKFIRKFPKSSQVIQVAILNAFAISRNKNAKMFLVSMLKNEKKLYRMVAVRGLTVYDPEVVAALINRLDETDEMVLKNIFDTLEQIAGEHPRVREQIIDYLDEINKKVERAYKKRQFKTTSLVASKNSETVQAIEKAIEAIFIIGNKSAAEQLLAILRSPDSEQRSAFRSRLQEIHLEGGKKHLLGALTQVLDFEKNWQRHEAINMIHASLNKLEDKGELRIKRLNAVALLGRIASSDCTPILLKMLSDPDDQVKIEVTQALGVIKDRTAIDLLIEIWGDNEWIIRANIASALGEIGHKRSVPFLKESFMDKDPWVRFNIVMALDKIGDISAGDVILHALKDIDRKVRAAAVKAVEHLPIPNREDILLSMLNDIDERVQANAIEALDNLSILAPIEGLTKEHIAPLLNSQNNRVCANAAKMYYRMDKQMSLQTLISMIKDPDQWMRSSAVWVLGELCDEQGIPHLIRALNDSSSRVRINAIKSLSKFRNPIHCSMIIDAIRKLEKGTRHETSIAIDMGVDDLDEKQKLMDILNK